MADLCAIQFSSIFVYSIKMSIALLMNSILHIEQVTARSGHSAGDSIEHIGQMATRAYCQLIENIRMD